MVRDIIAFGTTLRLRGLTLVGHSYGGTEAVRAAELHPESIRRVVLLDTAYDPIPADAPAAQSKLIDALTQMNPEDRLSSLDAYRNYEKRVGLFRKGPLPKSASCEMCGPMVTKLICKKP